MFILENNQTPESLIKISGSKFIGQVFKIVAENEVKQIMQQLKQLHPAATHICFAYRLRADGSTYRASDDGEPAGTAGLPILNVLKSKQITQALATVIRYYGGTNLGVSGLIQAYKLAVEETLQISNLVLYQNLRTITLACSIQYVDILKSKMSKLSIPFQLSFEHQMAIMQFSVNDKLYLEFVIPLIQQPQFQIRS